MIQTARSNPSTFVLGFFGLLGLLVACDRPPEPSASAPQPQSSAPAATTSWTSWGGPSGDFVVHAGAPLAESWPEAGPPVRWQRPLGKGYASILYLDGTLYTTYLEGEEEVAVAFDAASGETVWQHRRGHSLWPDMYQGFGLGPNATPLISLGTMITIGIDGVVQGLELEDGTLRWQRDLPADFGRLPRVEEYGYSGNPVAYEGGILALVGGDQAAVVGLDPSDGAVRWQSEPGGVSYAQPVIAELLQRPQYLYFEPEGVVALDPSDGTTLWKHAIEFNNGNHLTPAVAVDDRHLFISSQFPSGGGRLLALSDGTEGVQVEEVWFDAKLRASHWTLIAHGDHIYGSFGGNNTSYLAALRWRDGELLWRQRGFHKAQALWAEDKLLFLDETGQLALAKVTPEAFELLAQTPVVEPVAWTLPTLVGTTLYLRDQEKILAVELGN